MAPTLSASGSVGEWRTDGCGGERRGGGRAIQGRAWAMQATASWKTRTSMAKWAICVAKSRYDDAQRSATTFVISYFRNVKQLMTKGEKIMTSLCMLTFLAPSGFWLCNQHVAWTRLPGFHTVPCLVSRSYCPGTEKHLYYYSISSFSPPLSNQVPPIWGPVKVFLLLKGFWMMKWVTRYH